MFKYAQNEVIAVFLVFLLLTMNIFHTFFSVSVVDFEKWVLAGYPVFQVLNKHFQNL